MEAVSIIPKKEVFNYDEVVNLFSNYEIKQKSKKPVLKKKYPLCHIKDLVEEEFGVSVLEKGNHSWRMCARKAFIHLAYNFSTTHLTNIGKYLNKNHATIIFHLRNEYHSCKTMMEIDKDFKEAVERIEFRLKD